MRRSMKEMSRVGELITRTHCFCWAPRRAPVPEGMRRLDGQAGRVLISHAAHTTKGRGAYVTCLMSTSVSAVHTPCVSCSLYLDTLCDSMRTPDSSAAIEPFPSEHVYWH